MKASRNLTWAITDMVVGNHLRFPMETHLTSVVKVESGIL
jgi:hypothetical protein